MSSAVEEVQGARHSPPKLTDNSVWLYHAAGDMKTYRLAMFLEVPFVVTLAAVTPYPLPVLSAWAFLYFLALKVF